VEDAQALEASIRTALGSYDMPEVDVVLRITQLVGLLDQVDGLLHKMESVLFCDDDTVYRQVIGDA